MESLLDCLLDFAGAKRASGPPFGSTGNAPAGRPPGPQAIHPRGLCLENDKAVFHTAHHEKPISSSIYWKF
jgi:hypothetical protein